ncbi:MAG: DUF167 domain-containing protein [Kiritimatiellia bacterium]
MRINVKVVPRASKDELLGEFGDGLKVRVKAPPEDGKANAAVTRLVAAHFGVPASNVKIVAGASSSRKIIDITTPISAH